MITFIHRNSSYIQTLIAVGTIIASPLLSTAAPQDQETNPTQHLPPSQVSGEMDRLLQSFVDQGKVNCVAGFVAKGGDTLYRKAHGWKDVENKTPATIDDYYVLFSQTKAITTVAFMTLVEEGLVSIDDPVSQYFPEIPDEVVTVVHEDGTYETRPVASPMTFVHLMSHSSGLGSGLVQEIRKRKGAPNGAPFGFGGEIPQPTPSGQHSGGGNPYAQYLEEEMLNLVTLPLGFDPGSDWDYHISTNMLAYLIERISGKPLRQFVKERVLDPLGMDQTDWYYEPDALNRFVKAYRSVDGTMEPGSNLYSEGTISTQQTYAEGAIGLNGPIDDYAKFCQMLLNKGTFNGVRILKPETIEQMTTINRLPPGKGFGPGFQFGLGFELYREKKPVPAVSDTAFAWGGMFGTNYIIDPENDIIALFYINMYQADPSLYPQFLSKAYEMAGIASPKMAGGSNLTKSEVVLENGGTGPYPAMVTEDANLPGMTIFRPADLSPFKEKIHLPILLWGNGACANTAQEHKLFLNEIASHGYIVLAIGLLDQIAHRDESSREKTNASQLIDALDWIESQNRSPESAYAGTIDTAKVAAMGMSCGGLQAIEISGDPRIRTSVICNSGVLPGPSPLEGMPSLTKDALNAFHGPVLYIIGGPSDIAYGNAMDDFQRVNHVPIVMTNHDVGHGGTYHQPHGGEFTKVALPWLEWQLKGDTEASKMFLGEDCGLCNDPAWTIEVKGF